MMKKKLTTLVTVLLVCLLLFPTAAFAAYGIFLARKSG